MKVLKTFMRGNQLLRPGDDAPEDLDSDTIRHYKAHGMIGEPPKAQRQRAPRQPMQPAPSNTQQTGPSENQAAAGPQDGTQTPGPDQQSGTEPPAA